MVRWQRQPPESEAGCKLRTLQTDRGGEFTSGSFTAHCAEMGVERHLTTPYSPQQNGVVERRNQTIVGMARSLLKAKKIPGEFWGEAVSTAVFILNRSPTKSVDGKTPFEAWHGHKPNVHFMRTFGCVVHVRQTRPGLKKLDDRSRPMIFIGYEAGTKGYRAYDPVTQRVHTTRDAVFNESARWDWSSPDSPVSTFGDDSFAVVHMVLEPLSTPGDGSAGTQPDSPTSPDSTTSTPGVGSESTQAGSPSTHGSATGEFSTPPDTGVQFVTPPSRY